jgi:hypothetical protein
LFDRLVVPDASYKTNSYGYTINSLQSQQTKLKGQQADLEVQAARLRSLDRVSASNAAKNLVATNPWRSQAIINATTGRKNQLKTFLALTAVYWFGMGLCCCGGYFYYQAFLFTNN